MKLPKHLYSRLALVTCFTLIVGYFVVYATYQTILPAEYADGQPLSSALMGKIVGNLDDLNTRVSNMNALSPKAYVRFNGSTCSTTCSINSSYNISSVTYSSNRYYVNFSSPMSTANYVYNVTINARNSTNGVLSATIDSPSATTSSLSFQISGTLNGGNFGWVYSTSDAINIIVY